MNRTTGYKLMNAVFVMKLVIIALLMAGPVQSVIMPPRLLPSKPDPPKVESTLTTQMSHDLDASDDTPPYRITILQGESLEVEIESSSYITINLNRALPEDVNITVTVFSRPDLITFDGNASSAIIHYQNNTSGDRVVKFKTSHRPGHAEVVCKMATKIKDISVDDSNAYISVNINRSQVVNVLISIVGWLYFLAWSLSFYFQVILNYRRKSVVGLNFDFTALNLLGFTCYSIYNFALKFSREVQQDYYHSYTYSRIPVEINDLFFSVHAFVLTLITVIQCFIYERGQQSVSISASAFIGLTSLVGLGLFITHLFNGLSILDVVLYLSYVKLAITIIKYVPQAYMNYQRKATTGWSIHNILLDFTGGILSIIQMFLLASNYNDWVSIFGNFTKFGLGVVSITFDILFVVQHYFLYKQPAQLEDPNDDSIPSPVISQSIRSQPHTQPSQSQQDVEQPPLNYQTKSTDGSETNNENPII